MTEKSIDQTVFEARARLGDSYADLQSKARFALSDLINSMHRGDSEEIEAKRRAAISAVDAVADRGLEMFERRDREKEGPGS